MALADVIYLAYPEDDNDDCIHGQGMAKSVYSAGFYCVVCGASMYMVPVEIG